MLHHVSGNIADVCHAGEAVVDALVHFHILDGDNLTGSNIVVCEFVNSPARSNLYFRDFCEGLSALCEGGGGVFYCGLELSGGGEGPCQLSCCRRVDGNRRLGGAGAHAHICELQRAIALGSGAVEAEIIVAFSGDRDIVLIFSHRLVRVVC